MHSPGQLVLLSKGKGKAIPLQAWKGPGGSRRLKLPDFKKIGTWRWQGCQLYPPAAFTTKEIFLALISVRGPQGHSATGRIISMKKFQRHHCEQNPRPSSLQLSASIKRVTAQLTVPYIHILLFHNSIFYFDISLLLIICLVQWINWTSPTHTV